MKGEYAALSGRGRNTLKAILVSAAMAAIVSCEVWVSV